MKKVIIIGTGGHAKVVIDILEAMGGVEISGLTSKELKKDTLYCGYPVLGDDSVLPDLFEERKFDELAMGIGGYRDNILRKTVFDKLKLQGFSFITIIHPSAHLSSKVKLGEGCVVFPGVILNTEVKAGYNTIIATGASIDHETVIGNNALVSAGAIIGANVIIDDNTLVALGAKIVSGITVGFNALIGAGAVVIRNIEANSTYVGNPAKKIR